MAKDKNDLDTADWVDDADERRYKEEQAHARRVAKLEKSHKRQESARPTANRPRTRAP